MRLLELIFIVLVFSTQSVKQDEITDSDKIQGTWLPATAELGGKRFPEEIRKSIKLTIAGEKYTAIVGKNPDKGTIKLKPSTKPKALDVTGVEGPNKGKTILAIYDLDGDSWKICYDLSGKSRPKEFETKKGSQLFLVTYNREKQRRGPTREGK